MGIGAVEKVKDLLRISQEEGDKWDEEITSEVATADAIVETVLAAYSLTLPEETPDVILEARNNYAAWLFRRKRDVEGAQHFLGDADLLLKKYVESRRFEVQQRRCKVFSTNSEKAGKFWV